MRRMSVGGREIQGVLQSPGESRRDGIFAKGHKMIWSNPGHRVVLSAMVGLSLLAGAGQAGADAIKDLNNAFKDAYLGGDPRDVKETSGVRSHVREPLRRNRAISAGGREA